jgi:general secretion pathway protein K
VRRSARPERQRRARGVALVAVLLLVAGLIAIATAVVTMSVNQRRAAQRAGEADARRELLDGAMRVALAEIAGAKPEGPFWHPRQPRRVNIGGKPVEVSLEREGGRIDLNTADPKYVTATIVASGRTEAEARAAAARVQDWIDADDETRPGGAERREYQAAQLHYEPRNAQFESIDEVRQVLGLHDLTDATLDAFTVYSQQLEPHAQEAPQLVRDGIAWLDRSAGEGGVNAALPDTIQESSREPVSYAGSVIRLRACMADEKGTPCRMTVQRVTGSTRQPFQVFTWR